MVNEHINSALKTYVENPDPRYALMLKGKWGCGKTHLVDCWIRDTFKNEEKKDDVVLEPIRVTLYGMTNTDQITKAIDRQLHPYLYSKAAKMGKGILKILGKAVLRTDIDFDGDDKADITLSTSLDSLSFLSSTDDDIKPDTPKLLVFDDLERSHIPMKELLGYINYFVEYCGCHVIIVGDESKVKDEEKQILDDFKEKTIGREFEVEPDVDAAIASFADEIPGAEWLEKQISYIKKIFLASQCDNLRILRQCMYDFNLQYDEAEAHLLEKDTHVMKEILGSFVFTYCEYKGKERNTLKEFLSGKWNYISYREDSPEREALRKMEGKYKPESLDGINVMHIDHVANIVGYIEHGKSMQSYIDNLLRQSQAEVGVLDRLQRFREMENDEFEKNCKELAEDIKTGIYRQPYAIGRALAYFSLFEKEKLYQVNEAVLDTAKEELKDLFDNEAKDKEQLNLYRSGFWQGMNTVENPQEDHRIHNEMVKFIKDCYEERKRMLPDRMQQALATLSNDNILDLYKVHDGKMSANYSSYNNVPILNNIDVNELMEKLRGLNNANIRQFSTFLSHHFLLGAGLGSGFHERFKPDEDALRALKTMVEEEEKASTSIRMWAFQYLAKVIDGCIKRSEGDRGNLMEYV